MILIVSERLEPNVNAVEAILKARHAPYARFNTEDFPLTASLAIRGVRETPSGSLRISGQEVALKDITAVWYRRRGPFQLGSGFTPSEQEFIRGECGAALRGFWNLLECFWVNNPLRQRAASDKLLQLKMARWVGLDTPATLVTNEPQEVKAFYEQCGKRVCFKVLGSACLEEWETTPEGDRKLARYKFIYTNLLREQDFEKFETLRYTPAIFQEYVPKQFELRITVVGRTIFPAEIHSQKAPGERTQVDWRHYDLEHTPHKPHALPAPIAQKLLNLMDTLGLAFGCVDMIVTPDGRYVFLEINPAGQYMWIEGLVGFPITQTLAEMLIRGRMDA